MSSLRSYRQRVAAEVRAEMALQRRQGKDLARVLDCSPQSASKRMNGNVGFGLDELEKVGEWLGRDPGDIASCKLTGSSSSAVAS